MASALLLAGVVPVEGAPVTFTLNYTLDSGTGTGSGTFTVDDSLLAPNTTAKGLEYLLCVQITVSVPGVPVQTYTRNDLDDFIFASDSGGAITDVTFFTAEGGCPPGSFSIGGVMEFVLAFVDCATGSTIARFEARPSQGGVCDVVAPVPTLSPVGIAALVLLLATAALVLLLATAALVVVRKSGIRS